MHEMHVPTTSVTVSCLQNKINKNDGWVFLSPTAIVIFTVAILQQAVQLSLQISSLLKRVLHFMCNPRLAHIRLLQLFYEFGCAALVEIIISYCLALIFLRLAQLVYLKSNKYLISANIIALSQIGEYSTSSNSRHYII